MIPLPWQPLRKVLKILKSSLSPNQIAFGFALGIFAGLPPMGLHVIVPITLALLVRCSFSSFLISTGLFKLISFGLAPAGYALGRYLLDPARGLDGLWSFLFHLPVIAPIGYNRYLLLGSIVIAFGIAIPVFFIVRSAVVLYRARLAAKVKGWRITARLRRVRGIGILQWLFLGGKEKYDRIPPRGLFRYVRKEMLIGLPIIYLLCYLAAAVIVPFFAGRIATSAASFVIGGEVAVEESSFNLLTGRLNLDALTVQDPEKPEQNVLELSRVSLDVGMVPLLEKRVVFNELAVDEVYLHVVREQDGTMNIDNFSTGWNADGYIEWAKEHAGKVDWLGLVRKFIEYLSQPRPHPAPRPDLSRYAGGRSFPPPWPVFAIERVNVGRLHLTLTDLRAGGELPPITLTAVALENIAYPARLNRDPTGIVLRGYVGDDPNAAFALSARFEDGKEATYEFDMRKIDLAKLAAVYAASLPVKVIAGEATLTAKLTETGGKLTGEVSLALAELRIAALPGGTLFGLSPELSAQTIEGINRYAEDLPIVFGFAVDGSAVAPQLHWEKPLLEVAKQGLIIEGKRKISSLLEQRIRTLSPGEEVPLTGDYQKLASEVEARAKELLQGGSKQPPDISDTLNKLFRSLIPQPEEK